MLQQKLDISEEPIELSFKLLETVHGRLCKI